MFFNDTNLSELQISEYISSVPTYIFRYPTFTIDHAHSLDRLLQIVRGD